MLNLVSQVTTVIEDRTIPIGGQIWIYDKEIKTKDFKYMANLVGESNYRNEKNNESHFSAYLTARRNEWYKTRNRNEMFEVRYTPNENNNSNGITGAVNRLNDHHENQSQMGTLANDLTKVLNFCVSNDTAIHMMHSQHFNEDLVIPAIIKTMSELSKVTLNETEMDIDNMELLPKEFSTKSNYELHEFEIITKENKTILYNAYIPCLHNASPCYDCHTAGVACKERMKTFISNLYC